jgi:hypothetical protein
VEAITKELDLRLKLAFINKGEAINKEVAINKVEAINTAGD